MTPKLVVITEIIAPYRIPVFNALAQRPEIDLQVIFLSENDPTLRQWMVYKEEIKFRYRILPSWRKRFGKHNVLLNRGVGSTLSELNPDVIICGGYNYPAGWSAAFWARRRHVPFLLWTESTAMDQRRRYAAVELMKKRYLDLCTGFVVPGKSSLDYLRRLGVSEKGITVAPNAVDTWLFSNLAEAARQNEMQVRTRHRLPARYFLFVGRLVEDKGIFDLLDAYAQLSADIRGEIGLIYLGDGVDRPRLVDKASKIAPRQIQFPGFLQRDELPQIYALADALIFPTHSDPWGLVVNEAMASGLPIVASSVAGCTEDLVREGWNGFVIPPRDPVALAAAMTKIANDSDLRAAMGLRSRERIHAYSPTAWAKGIVDAVDSAMEGTP